MKTFFAYTNLYLLVVLVLTGINAQAQCPDIIRGPYLQPGDDGQATNSINVHWRSDSNNSMHICFKKEEEDNFYNCLNISPDAQDIVVPYKDNKDLYFEVETVYNYQYEVDFSKPPFNDGFIYEYRIQKNGIACLLEDNSGAKGILNPYPSKGTAINETLDIWVVGDGGGGDFDDVKNVYDAYTEDKNYDDDFIMLLGDNAYTKFKSTNDVNLNDLEEFDDCSGYCSRTDGGDYAYEKSIFASDKMQDLLKNQIMWPTIGNHEVDYYFNQQATGEDNIEEFFAIFPFIDKDKGYYSYDYGEAHFICLNSEITDYIFGYNNSEKINAMVNWLEDDLTDNSEAKWTIVYFHHPVHTASMREGRNTLIEDNNLEEEAELMIDNILPVLYDYNVDLVFTGHSHHYERSFLTHNQDDQNTEHFCKDGDISERSTSVLHDGSPNNDYLEDYLEEVEDYDYDLFQNSVYPKEEEGTVFVVLGSSAYAYDPCDAGSSYADCFFDHPIMAPLEAPHSCNGFESQGRGLHQRGSGHLSIQGDELTFEFIVQDGSSYEVRDRFTIDKSAEDVLECIDKITYYHNDVLPLETHTSNYIKYKAVTVEDGQDIKLFAENYIELLPRTPNYNFHTTLIEYGANFETFIEPCVAGKNNLPKEFLSIETNPELLTVYPNPFSEKFNVTYHLEATSPVSIYLYNSTGKLEQTIIKQEVHSLGDHTYTIDGSQLSPGVYIINIITKDQKISQKLVKI